MQRFKDFTKKSGKVASAILSAAMVTSMVAGTNVVYAANTEVTTEETDVTAEQKTKAEIANAVAKAFKSLPVNAGTETTDIVSGGALTEKVKDTIEEKVKDSIGKPDVTSGGAVSGVAFTITKNPTNDEKGTAELTFEYDSLKRTVEYELPNGTDRQATLKAAIEEKVEKATADFDADAILADVADDTDETTGMKLYADLKTIAEYKNGLTITSATDDKEGSAKGTFVAGQYDKKASTTGAKKLNDITISVNKTLPTLKETVETAGKNFETYLETVKYFNTSMKNTNAANAIVGKFAKDNNVTVSGSAIYTVKSDADKAEAGKAGVKVAFSTTGSSVEAKVDKNVIIPSDEQKTDLILSDLVKYAKASSNDSNDAFYADFAKAFNEDNTKINTAKDVDADDFANTLVTAVDGVYGNTETAKVEFGVKAGKTVADITVQFGDADEKTETVELTGAQEAPKDGFQTVDGKKCFVKNGEVVKNSFITADETGDGYTYYAQADGSIMQDRLTYAPNGVDILYFDADGHMVFDKFMVAKKDMNGNPLEGNPVYFFNSEGRMYINQTTYGSGKDGYDANAMYYINEYGVLLQNGWYKTADGNITYAAADGKLTTSQWGLDQFGRKVYFQANGFLAKGLITDGVKYYQLDENDGHLVGEF